jgi:hypothetical protein
VTTITEMINADFQAEASPNKISVPTSGLVATEMFTGDRHVDCCRL